MKLIKPSYEIITPINGEEILKQVELAARTCYKSEDKIQYEDEIIHEQDKSSIINSNLTVFDNGERVISKSFAKSARVLIPKLISRGHEAMLEFGGMITVRFICDRGVSHELVRHRVASFAQESTRYCNYGNCDDIQFIIPSWFKRTSEGVVRNVMHIDKLVKEIDGIDYEFHWVERRLAEEEEYNELIRDAHWSPQEARSVLPNALKTEICASANVREFRHILNLRCAPAAHPQMRELMLPLLNELHNKIPILFDDIYEKYFLKN
jgi:thymidylate synthase (FAD)